MARDNRDSHDDESEEAGSNESSNEKGSNLSETLKKLLSTGLGAAFLTEDVIRSYLQDVKLPKDVLNLLLQQAGRSKEDLMNRIGNETIRMISKIDFVKEASRFVENHKFKISAEVEVLKKKTDDTP
jgi:hypothetical protein